MKPLKKKPTGVARAVAVPTSGVNPKKKGVLPSLLRKTKSNKDGAKRLANFSQKQVKPPIAKLKIKQGSEQTKISDLTDNDELFRMLKESGGAASGVALGVRPPVEIHPDTSHDLSSLSNASSVKRKVARKKTRSKKKQSAPPTPPMFDKQAINPQPGALSNIPAKTARPATKPLKPSMANKPGANKQVMELDSGLQFSGPSPVELNPVVVQKVPVETDTKISPSEETKKPKVTLRKKSPPEAPDSEDMEASKPIAGVERVGGKPKKIAFEKVKALLNRMNPRPIEPTCEPENPIDEVTFDAPDPEPSIKTADSNVEKNFTGKRTSSGPVDAPTVDEDATQKTTQLEPTGVSQTSDCSKSLSSENPDDVSHISGKTPTEPIVLHTPTAHVTNSFSDSSKEPTIISLVDNVPETKHSKSTELSPQGSSERPIEVEKSSSSVSSLPAPPDLSKSLSDQERNKVPVDAPYGIEFAPSLSGIGSQSDRSHLNSTDGKLSDENIDQTAPEEPLKEVPSITESVNKDPNTTKMMPLSAHNPKAKIGKDPPSGSVMLKESEDSLEDVIPAPPVDAAAMMAALESTLEATARPSPRRHNQSPGTKTKSRLSKPAPLVESPRNTKTSSSRQLSKASSPDVLGAVQKMNEKVASDIEEMDNEAMQENIESNKVYSHIGFPREIATAVDDAISDLDQSLRDFPVRRVVANGSITVSTLDNSNSSDSEEEGQDRYAPIVPPVSTPEDKKAPKQSEALADSITEWSVEQQDSGDTAEVAVQAMMNTCNQNPLSQFVMKSWETQPALKPGNQVQLPGPNSSATANGASLWTRLFGVQPTPNEHFAGNPALPTSPHVHFEEPKGSQVDEVNPPKPSDPHVASTIEDNSILQASALSVLQQPPEQTDTPVASNSKAQAHFFPSSDIHFEEPKGSQVDEVNPPKPSDPHVASTIEDNSILQASALSVLQQPPEQTDTPVASNSKAQAHFFPSSDNGSHSAIKRDPSALGQATSASLEETGMDRIPKDPSMTDLPVLSWDEISHSSSFDRYQSLEERQGSDAEHSDRYAILDEGGDNPADQERGQSEDSTSFGDRYLITEGSISKSSYQSASEPSEQSVGRQLDAILSGDSSVVLPYQKSPPVEKNIPKLLCTMSELDQIALSDDSDGVASSEKSYIQQVLSFGKLFASLSPTSKGELKEKVDGLSPTSKGTIEKCIELSERECLEGTNLEVIDLTDFDDGEEDDAVWLFDASPKNSIKTQGTIQDLMDFAVLKLKKPSTVSVASDKYSQPSESVGIAGETAEEEEEEEDKYSFGTRSAEALSKDPSLMVTGEETEKQDNPPSNSEDHSEHKFSLGMSEDPLQQGVSKSMGSDKYSSHEEDKVSLGISADILQQGVSKSMESDKYSSHEEESKCHQNEDKCSRSTVDSDSAEMETPVKTTLCHSSETNETSVVVKGEIVSLPLESRLTVIQGKDLDISNFGFPTSQPVRVIGQQLSGLDANSMEPHTVIVKDTQPVSVVGDEVVDILPDKSTASDEFRWNPQERQRKDYFDTLAMLEKKDNHSQTNFGAIQSSADQSSDLFYAFCEKTEAILCGEVPAYEAAGQDDTESCLTNEKPFSVLLAKYSSKGESTMSSPSSETDCSIDRSVSEKQQSEKADLDLSSLIAKSKLEFVRPDPIEDAAELPAAVKRCAPSPEKWTGKGRPSPNRSLRVLAVQELTNKTPEQTILSTATESTRDSNSQLIKKGVVTDGRDILDVIFENAEAMVCGTPKPVVNTVRDVTLQGTQVSNSEEDETLELLPAPKDTPPGKSNNACNDPGVHMDGSSAVGAAGKVRPTPEMYLGRSKYAIDQSTKHGEAPATELHALSQLPANGGAVKSDVSSPVATSRRINSKSKPKNSVFAPKPEVYRKQDQIKLKTSQNEVPDKGELPHEKTNFVSVSAEPHEHTREAGRKIIVSNTFPTTSASAMAYYRSKSLQQEANESIDMRSDTITSSVFASSSGSVGMSFEKTPLGDGHLLSADAESCTDHSKEAKGLDEAIPSTKSLAETDHEEVSVVVASRSMENRRVGEVTPRIRSLISGSGSVASKTRSLLSCNADESESFSVSERQESNPETTPHVASQTRSLLIGNADASASFSEKERSEAKGLDEAISSTKSLAETEVSIVVASRSMESRSVREDMSPTRSLISGSGSVASKSRSLLSGSADESESFSENERQKSNRETAEKDALHTGSLLSGSADESESFSENERQKSNRETAEKDALHTRSLLSGSADESESFSENERQQSNRETAEKDALHTRSLLSGSADEFESFSENERQQSNRETAEKDALHTRSLLSGSADESEPFAVSKQQESSREKPDNQAILFPTASSSVLDPIVMTRRGLDVVDPVIGPDITTSCSEQQSYHPASSSSGYFSTEVDSVPRRRSSAELFPLVHTERGAERTGNRYDRSIIIPPSSSYEGTHPALLVEHNSPFGNKLSHRQLLDSESTVAAYVASRPQKNSDAASVSASTETPLTQNKSISDDKVATGPGLRSNQSAIHIVSDRQLLSDVETADERSFSTDMIQAKRSSWSIDMEHVVVETGFRTSGKGHSSPETVEETIVTNGSSSDASTNKGNSHEEVTALPTIVVGVDVEPGQQQIGHQTLVSHTVTELSQRGVVKAIDVPVTEGIAATSTIVVSARSTDNCGGATVISGIPVGVDNTNKTKPDDFANTTRNECNSDEGAASNKTAAVPEPTKCELEARTESNETEVVLESTTDEVLSPTTDTIENFPVSQCQSNRRGVVLETTADEVISPPTNTVENLSGPECQSDRSGVVLETTADEVISPPTNTVENLSGPECQSDRSGVVLETTTDEVSSPPTNMMENLSGSECQSDHGEEKFHILPWQVFQCGETDLPAGEKVIKVNSESANTESTSPKDLRLDPTGEILESHSQLVQMRKALSPDGLSPEKGPEGHSQRSFAETSSTPSLPTKRSTSIVPQEISLGELRKEGADPSVQFPLLSLADERGLPVSLGRFGSQGDESPLPGPPGRSSTSVSSPAVEDPPELRSQRQTTGIHFDDDSDSADEDETFTDGSSLLLALTRSDGDVFGETGNVSYDHPDPTNDGHASKSSSSNGERWILNATPSHSSVSNDDAGEKTDLLRSASPRRLRCILERLRVTNRRNLLHAKLPKNQLSGTGSDTTVGSDQEPADVDELFSRYDNIVKHMVLLDDERLKKAQSKKATEIIDVTDASSSLADSSRNRARVGSNSKSFESETTTPSQKARNLRQQLDEALKTSAAIRTSQERLGAELSTFKNRLQQQRRSMSPATNRARSVPQSTDRRLSTPNSPNGLSTSSCRGGGVPRPEKRAPSPPSSRDAEIVTLSHVRDEAPHVSRRTHHGDLDDSGERNETSHDSPIVVEEPSATTSTKTRASSRHEDTPSPTLSETLKSFERLAESRKSMQHREEADSDDDRIALERMAHKTQTESDDSTNGERPSKKYFPSDPRQRRIEAPERALLDNASSEDDLFDFEESSTEDELYSLMQSESDQSTQGSSTKELKRQQLDSILHGLRKNDEERKQDKIELF